MRVRTVNRSSWNRRLRGQMWIGMWLFAVWSPPAWSADWPQWLGPNRNAEWKEDGIIERFPPKGPKLRWTAPVGSGYSGPAVSDGRVIVMDRQTDLIDPSTAKLLHDGPAPRNENFVRRELPGRERVVCLNESDGTPLWIHGYDCPYTTVTRYAIGPRVTPTIDDDLVFTLGAEGHLYCLNVDDGSEVWSIDFRKRYGLKVPEWGLASHPLVDGERLICMVGGRGSTCVAFDKRTGKELWRARDAAQPGYCPPVIYQLGGRRQLVIWDSDAVSGLNPETGSVYWSVPFQATYAMSIGAPQQSGNKLFVMCFNRQSACITVADDGMSAEISWRGNTRRGIAGVMNTARLEDGYIYACGESGRYTCARLDTGERLWTTYKPSTGRRPAAWANVFTVKQGDRYFLANDLGDVAIARLSPDGYEEISRAHLIDPTHSIGSRTVIWSHPAFANRSIYLRNDAELRCYSLAISSD